MGEWRPEQQTDRHVPPFSYGIKSLRNKANDDNPENTDTPRTDKDDTSHTNRYDSIKILQDTKNTNDDDEYKEDTSKHQDSNESVGNPETSDTSHNEIVINTTK